MGNISSALVCYQDILCLNENTIKKWFEFIQNQPYYFYG